MTKERNLLAATESLAPSEVRTEELAQISKDLAEANALTSNDLAEANVLLAKTTQASAELLAKITQESADQLRKSNEVSTRMLNRLTIVLVAVGLIQIAVTAIALFAHSN